MSGKRRNKSLYDELEEQMGAKSNRKWSVLLSPTTLFVLTFVLLESGLAILQKKVAQQMTNYPATLTIAQPICTTFFFGIGALFVHLNAKQKRKTQGYSTINTPEFEPESLLHYQHVGTNDTFPKWRFAVLGVLFTIFNFGIFTGSRGHVLPLFIIVMLKQAAIPFTMIVSFFALRKRFKVFHYLGAILILVGIFLCIWPEIHEKGFALSQDNVWAIAVILGAALALSCAAVFLEHSLKLYPNLEMLNVWFWINFFEVIVAIPIVLCMVPIQKIDIKDAPRNVLNGFNCLLTGHASMVDDTCNQVGFWFIGFIGCLLLDKVNQGYLLRHTSSTLMWIASTVAVPLASFAFMIPFLGLEHSPFDWFRIGGLITVLFGLVFYRSTKEGDQEET